MQAFKQKLKSKNGETIAEVLVATLIAALSLLMLASAVMSATHIVTNGEKKMNQFYSGMSAIETQDTATKDGTVSITIDRDNEAGRSDIKLENEKAVPKYKDSTSGLQSYQK